MHALRTPDEHFADLPDFGFEPHFVTIGDTEGGELRVHYVEEGPADADPVLLLHGEPTWSFLYRYMIPPLVDAGHRVVAPDLVGFGRSDKPAERSDHTYARHVHWLESVVVEGLNLSGITLFCQDWGGLLGLRLVAAHPDRFDRVVASNTFLPTGDAVPTDAFLRWQRFSQEVPELPVGAIVQGGTTTDLGAEVRAGYDAPYPDESYKAGPRTLPTLVPTAPDDPEAGPNRAAWESLRRYTKPFLCAFSDCDPVTAGGERTFVGIVPGTRGQRHTTIAGGGHFVQEDRGPELAQVVADFVAAT
jgi:haloalkane dehalogenase